MWADGEKIKESEKEKIYTKVELTILIPIVRPLALPLEYLYNLASGIFFRTINEQIQINFCLTKKISRK